MRMNSNIVNHRKLVGAVSAEPLLNATNRVEYKPPTDKSLQRHKITLCRQSSLPLENSQINLKRQSRQTSLSDFIHSLFSGKKRVEHILGDIEERNGNVSCPNINNREIVEKKFWRGHTEKTRNEKDNMKRASSAKKFSSSDVVSISQPSFQVPNIFITSLTRSCSDDKCCMGSTTVEQKMAVCKTSPVLSEGSSQANKSDRKCQEQHVVINSEFCHYNFQDPSQGRLYRNEHMAQITPYLFVGRAEAANDQRLLCKLDIHSLIDITNSPTYYLSSFISIPDSFFISFHSYSTHNSSLSLSLSLSFFLSFVETQKQFDSADTEKTGKLRFRDIVFLLARNGFRRKYNEAKRIFQELDTDEDKLISREEFMAAMDKIPEKNIKEMGMRKLFKEIDKDSSGYLTFDELNSAIQNLALDVNTEKISDILIHLCQSSEKIDYENFLEMYANQ
ncbi:CPK [Acanthosepion pharaonis]|uniref:CPK n=1 Tax=Acanthosepion pharaonis TaxID=158019 RepID=A0A812ECQ0_ACAPH|nr:CPK [Sepia pharaonis]